MKFSDPIKISKQIISLPILESLFSVNRGILDLIGDVATFCLDIQAKLLYYMQSNLSIAQTYGS